ncbi:MAG: hypothetical protein HQ500_06525 [Flavobacteriales bacterium]|nr:hypothetical protein [Flavobacteriales bacterium]
MEAKEYPFYGIGIIAFSMASADGVIQGRERHALQEMLREWSDQVEVGYDVTEIIFHLFVKTASPEELTYERGMHYITLGKDYLTERIKEKFIFLINDVAHSFPPVTEVERALIKRFRADIKHL